MDKLLTLEQATDLYILNVYISCCYNKSKTAEILGISYKTLIRKIKKINQDLEIVIIQKKNPEIKIFPTNEERIKYKDEMLNRNYL